MASAPAALEVSPTTADVPSGGGTVDVAISNSGGGTLSWTASSNQAWATLSAASGSGDATPTVTVAANTTFASRQATITVTAAGATGSPKTVVITQAANEYPSPTVTGVTPAAGAQGTNVAVTVTGTGFAAGATTFDFGTGITVGSVSVASATSASMNLTIAGGASAGTRDVSATNPAPGGGTGSLPSGFTVTLPPALEVSPATADVPAGGGTVDVAITNSGGGTLSWTASSNQAWATLSAASGSGDATPTVTVAANNTFASRQATITVSAAGASGSPKTVVITQAANEYPSPTVTGVSPASGAQGTNVAVTVTGTGFAAGVTTFDFGAGITVGSVSVASATSASMSLTIAGGASAGTRDVSATNPAPGGGTGSLPAGFTVTLPPALEVSPATANVPAGGGTVDVAITNSGGGTLSWTASSNQAWATLSAASGSGDATPTVTVAANTTFASRQATVTVSAAGATGSPKTVVITQAANEYPSPTVTGVSPASGAQGTNVAVTVTGTGFAAGVTTFDFGAGITVGSVSVASATSASMSLTIAGGASAGTRDVSATNPTPGGGTGSLPSGFTVTLPPALEVSPATANVPSGGGTVDVAITNSGGGTLSWTASSNQAWATLSAASGSGDATPTVTVAANNTFASRQATITVSAAGASGSPKTVVITQAANEYPSPTVSAVSPASGAQGTNVAVTVTGTGFAAGVTTFDFGAGITVGSVSVASATSATMSLTIAGGASASTRDVSATNPAPGGGTGSLPAGFTVTLPPALEVSPATADVPAGGGTVDVTITNSGGGTLSWTASSNQAWATLSAASGSGDATPTVTVAANTTFASRQATVTVSAAGATGSPKTVVITQAANEYPVPTVTGVSPAVGNSGSVVQVTVTGSGFYQGATTFDFGSGTTVQSSSVTSLTSAIVTLSINLAATGGTRTVSVTNPTPGGGTGNLPDAFTVISAPALSVSPTTANVGATGGSISISITNVGGGTLNWSASSNQTWASVSDASGSGNSTLTVTVSANSLLTSRMAEVTISATGANNAPQTVTITQAASDQNPTPVVIGVIPSGVRPGKSAQVSINGSGFLVGQTTFSFGAGVTVDNVTVISPSSAEVTLSVSSGATVGTRTVTATNPGPGGGVGSLTNGFNVLPPLMLTLNPDQLTVPVTGGNYSVSVVVTGGSTNWSAASNQNWLQLTSVNGSGSSALAFTTSPNPNASDRQATILVTGDDNDNGPQHFIVTQLGTSSNAPIAIPDHYETIMNQTLTIAAPGVLGNDQLPAGVTQITANISGPSSNSFGSILLSSNGGFVFTPATDAVGGTTFNYSAVNPTSSASTMSTIEIIIRPPAPSHSGEPGSGPESIGNGGELSWGAVPGANSYNLEYSTEPFEAKVSSNHVVRVSGLTENRYTLPTSLELGTTYYWRVQSVINSILSPFSESRSFSIVPPPNPVVLVAPANNATNVPVKPTFEWTTVENAESYTFELISNQDFSNPQIQITGIEETSITLDEALTGGPVYYWRVIAIGIGGTSDPSEVFTFTRETLTSVDSDGSDVPTEFSVGHNYPNPFNPSTTLRVNLPQSADVAVTVYDLTGRVVMQLPVEAYRAGRHTIALDASRLNSGVYLYRIRAGTFEGVGKMTLVK